jgi:xanthine dehydrogenase YagR molybdenum-binding subunit
VSDRPTDLLQPVAIGRGMERRDGLPKVTGRAPYAYEITAPNPAYCRLVQAPMARGRVESVSTAAARELRGVRTVLTVFDAEPLTSDEGELAVLQNPAVAFRGQVVGLVVADTAEIAQQAADLVDVRYSPAPHDVALAQDRDDLYAPEKVNPSYETDTATGDMAAAMATAEVTVEQTYTTATYHNNPLEPHATTAYWDGEHLTLWDSTQACTPPAPRSPACSASTATTSASSAPTSAAASGPRASRTPTSSSPRWPRVPPRVGT